MWKILGQDALYVEIPDTWKKRMLELSGLSDDPDKAEKFRDVVGKSEVSYLLNGTTEEHTFFIRVPDEITPEEIQILADVALDVLKKSEAPCIEVEGEFEIYEDDSVGVNFTLSYSLKGRCSYCLAEALQKVRYSYEALFVPDSDDDDNYRYSGARLDIMPAVEDAFVFSQPNVLLCKSCMSSQENSGKN